MHRAPTTASRTAHPYRDVAATLENETGAVKYGRALFVAQSFLVVWSLARIVVDVSCRRIDAEGFAALVLCATMLPKVARRWRAKYP